MDWFRGLSQIPFYRTWKVDSNENLFEPKTTQKYMSIKHMKITILDYTC